MHATDLVSDLFATCEAEISRLLDGFEAAPTCTGLFDVGAVAEMVVLGYAVPGIEPLRNIVSGAAARWLRSGVLEDFCFSRVELSCYTAMLACLAQRSDTYSPGDMAVMKRLCEGRLIGRSEMPVLTQRLTAAYLTRCGIDADFGDLGRRDLAGMIDRRVLRARSDEYDLLNVIMCAQLLHLEPHAPHSRPSLFPHALLVQAIRSGNANWAPVLAYLCANWFSLKDGLRSASLRCLLENLPARGELLPAPRGAVIDSEYIGRAGRGLRIRSTLALAFSLCTPGDSYAENRASLAVC
jgi:hypothetical protein